MTTPITDEALAEIKAGLEGVTPGPWRMEIETLDHVEESEEDRQQQVFVCSPSTICDCTVVATMGCAESISLERKSQDAAHIARMDPATVASMIARIEAAEARVKALEEALQPFADAASSYDPNTGDDRDAAWVHDFPIGALRRARAALEGE